MALINIDIDYHLDEAGTEYLIAELKRRKVDVIEIISKIADPITDEDFLKIISRQKQLNLQQAERLEHCLKTL